MNYAGLPIFILACLVFYVALPMYESCIWRKQKDIEIAELKHAIQQSMACGHSPVDSGTYHVKQQVKYLRKVIANSKNSVL